MKYFLLALTITGLLNVTFTQAKSKDDLASANPSLSVIPSSNPSISPSSNPSSTNPSASSLPSRSAYPSTSVLPSSNPSKSLNPTTSSVPSTDPSSWPTSQPSKSNTPSISTLPSSHPSISTAPSISSNPTESINPTWYPSLLPSFQPSLSVKPSISHIPSSFPSEAPSLNPAATYRTTLAIRVVAADVSTSASASKLSDKIFGTGFSLLSQYEACSYGNLIFLPFKGSTSTGEEVSNGVGEVTITNNANGTSAAMLRSVVQTAAEKKYGDLGSQFDNVLFCLPPGTILQGGTDWVGFAFYDYWMAAFNDLYCTYPSALMHEIGHNLGMAHSDEDYGDESCMMGFSYELEDGPLQCFNGAKSWQLGWYSEAHMSINITELSDWDSYEVNITGAADFNGRSDQTVIIQLTGSSTGLEYYIAFNRKTGINSGTQEGGDKVLITNREAGQGIADSTLMAELEDGGDFFVHSTDFKPNVVIHVNSINLNTDPAYASLYISKYHKICYSDSYCNDRDTCTVDTCVPGMVNGSIIFPDPVNAGQCNFETLPCTECGAKFGVQIVTNEYPEYTTWSLYDIGKKMEVLSGGPYTDNYTVYNMEKCLQLGDYNFTIYDSKNSTLSGSPEYSLSMQGEVTMSSRDLLSFRQLERRSVDKIFIQSNDFGPSVSQMFDIVCSEEECKDYDACTQDIFDPETRLCLYKPISSCPNSTKFSVNITTDQYGDETSWSIINLHDKKLVLNGGPYVGFGRRKQSSATKRRRLTNDDGIETYITEVYLEDSFYGFNIHDEFGDGMCCDYGNGGYGVSLNDVEVVSGGEFDFNTKTSYDLNVCASDSDCDDFDDCTEDECLENTCIYSQMKCEDCGKVKVVVYIYTDWIPEEISWIVSTGSTGTGDVVMSGNSYSDIEYLYVESKCSDLGTYTFSIFDSGGNGICCEMGNGYYKMTVGNDNVQVLQGGDFDLLEEITFNIDTTPSDKPSSIPSIMPSMVPSNMPSMSFLPSLTQLPSSSLYPTKQPSNSPSKSSIPSISLLPSTSVHPSNYPSISVYPSSHPSSLPSQLPSGSIIPSANPSMTEYSSSLAVKVKTDDYPGEITWKVVDSSDDIIVEGGLYDEAWTGYNNVYCINRGLYSFIIYDRLGSGSIFDGYYMLSLDNAVIKSASSFERTETTTFTISDTFEPTLSMNPSSNPSEQNLPTGIPSLSMSPSDKPSVSPTIVASQSPSLSIIPTFIPSNMPSEEPTLHPSTSLSPSTTPTNQPTKTPSLNPSVSHLPSVSQKPSFSIPIPTLFPSQSPSNKPSYEPSLKPSVGPTNVHSNSPSNMPSNVPSTSPSDIPSDVPSSSSSPSSRFAIYSCPALPTRQPTSRPSLSSYPSIVPSLSNIPSLNPSTSPSMSMIPSSRPSLTPSSIPSSSSKPSSIPSSVPSLAPSTPPTSTLSPTSTNDSFMVSFTNVTSSLKSTPPHIDLAFVLSGKKLDDIDIIYLDGSCNVASEIKDNSVYELSVDYTNNDSQDEAVVSIGLDTDAIFKNKDLFINDVISFCLRADMTGRSVGYEGSISFTETVVTLDFDMESGFEIKDVSMEGIEAMEVNKTQSFNVDACICSVDGNKATCSAKKLKQNSEFDLCIFSLSDVTEIDSMISMEMEQSGKVKFSPIVNSNTNPFTQVFTNQNLMKQDSKGDWKMFNAARVSSRVVSAFFVDKKMDPVIIKGTVLLAFASTQKRNRKLLEDVKDTEESHFAAKVLLDDGSATMKAETSDSNSNSNMLNLVAIIAGCVAVIAFAIVVYLKKKN